MTISRVVHCFYAEICIRNQENNMSNFKKQKRMKRKILYVGTFAELARFVELQVSDGYRVDDDDEEEMAYV